MNFCLDSSALVKLYIDEVGSDRIKEIVFSEKNNVFISKITGAEVVAAFSRRRRTLRGYDAVQLASALTLSTEINEGMIFISADIDLNGMAKAEGLVVEDLEIGEKKQFP